MLTFTNGNLPQGELKIRDISEEPDTAYFHHRIGVTDLPRSSKFPGRCL